MPVERWGALSVKDHLDTQALVADLLLYDRLVFPVFSRYGERTRWRGEGWDPDLQEQLIEDLGEDVAIKAVWNATRLEKFNELRKTHKLMANDAFATTRMVLAMDRTLPVPADGLKPRVVAAFNDVEEGQKEIGLTLTELHDQAEAEIAIVVKQRLLIPAIREAINSRDIVLRARDLSLSPKFRSQRQEYYAWQEQSADDVVIRGKSVERVVSELEVRANQLNNLVVHYMADHWPEVGIKTALTVIGVGLPFVLGVHHLELAGFVPGAYELAKFGILEVAEPATARKPEAAAMLVSARKGVRK